MQLNMQPFENEWVPIEAYEEKYRGELLFGSLSKI
jgi:hypothetical protein